nr:protein kinase [Corynebacterium lactis]
MAQVFEGDVLDERYLIGATIARGGMSTVYRATDLRLDRPVAAKVMDPRYVDDASFRARFEREARAVAHLNDESLVNVYDQGTDRAGHVFLIMEFVDGGTLRELLRERGPMPPHAATAVMRSVLRALSVAHSRGMVHRDVKPENVLISSTGKVKLADFGLVRAAADAKLTSNSVIVGTVAYLSPEQVTGHTITPASDVYSAGILLFELLTGSTPFTADSSLGVAMKRLSEDVPPPSELIDGVPAEFDELVATACMRNPADRFVDAVEFAEALDDVAVELALPPFRVPAPTDSAAAQAAASPMPTPRSQTSGLPSSGDFGTGNFGAGDFGTEVLPAAREGQSFAEDAPNNFVDPAGPLVPMPTGFPANSPTRPEPLPAREYREYPEPEPLPNTFAPRSPDQAAGPSRPTAADASEPGAAARSG